MISKLIVEENLGRTPLARQGFELVERKGKGHPDSLCDARAEEVSLAFCESTQPHSVEFSTTMRTRRCSLLAVLIHS